MTENEAKTMSDDVITVVREWLSGAAIEQSCGFGPNGPNVQVKRPDGAVALIELRTVAAALLGTPKAPGYNTGVSLAERVASYAASPEGKKELEETAERVRKMVEEGDDYSVPQELMKHPMGFMPKVSDDLRSPNTVVPVSIKVCVKNIKSRPRCAGGIMDLEDVARAVLDSAIKQGANIHVVE